VQLHTSGETGPRHDVTVFNAEQTTDFAAIARRVQECQCRSGISGKTFGGSFALLLQEVAANKKYKSNFWVTPQQLSCFVGVELKPGEVGVPFKVKDELTGAERALVFYNAEQTTDPKKIQDCASAPQPLSSQSGKPYPSHIQVALQSASANNQYRSVFWVTSNQLSSFAGVSLKPGSVGVTIRDKDQQTGVERDVTFYNAEQTTDAKAIGARATSVQMCSGFSGRAYPLEVQLKLREIALKRNHKSPYWLTLNQLQYITPPLQLKEGVEGTEVTFQSGQKAIIYNADQTTAPEAVQKHVKALQTGNVHV
jgi:hypothetical protein